MVQTPSSGMPRWKVVLQPMPGDQTPLREILVQAGADLAEHPLDLKLMPADGIMLLDGESPQLDGLLRASYETFIPVIVLTNRETGPLLLESGAWDYLVKDELNPELVRRSLRYVTYQQWILTQLNARTHDLHGVEALYRDTLFEKEELQAALEKERELTRMKSAFMNTLSHEFRTPLAMIMAASELLIHYFESMTEEKRRTRLVTIQAQIRHLEAMIDEVSLVMRSDLDHLDFHPQKLNFREFCERVVEEIRSTIGANRDILFSVLDGDYDIQGDVKLLRYIIGNLLGNAIKYSDAGTVIRFDLARRPTDILFSVRDQGIGIPPQDQEHLFEPFYRASNVGSINGTGLGLKVVKDCVTLHGGSIEIESKVSVGTRCTVKLPVVTPTPQ